MATWLGYDVCCFHRWSSLQSLIWPSLTTSSAPVRHSVLLFPSHLILPDNQFWFLEPKQSLTLETILLYILVCSTYNHCYHSSARCIFSFFSLPLKVNKPGKLMASMHTSSHSKQKDKCSFIIFAHPQIKHYCSHTWCSADYALK